MYVYIEREREREIEREREGGGGVEETMDPEQWFNAKIRKIFADALSVLLCINRLIL